MNTPHRLITGLIAALLTLSPAARADLTARGSDSTLHVIKALAVAFEAETGKKITVEGGGSGAGAKAAISSEVGLAFLSRELKPQEKEAGLVGQVYARDGVAVIIHKSNPASNLTIGELKAIFTGQTKTWADGKPVVAYNRNADSGTREVFQEHVLGKDPFSPTAAIKHDGIIISSVEKIPTAIAYTSLGEVDASKVKVLSIAGVQPSQATLLDGSYAIARSPTLATKGAATGDAKAFIDFILGAKGQAIVAEHGLIPVK